MKRLLTGTSNNMLRTVCSFIVVLAVLVCRGSTTSAKDIFVDLHGEEPNYAELSAWYYAQKKSAKTLKHIYQNRVDSGLDATKIQIPFAWYYTIEAGDTLDALSQRYFGHTGAVGLIKLLNPTVRTRTVRRRTKRSRKKRRRSRYQASMKITGLTPLTAGKKLLIPAVIQYKTLAERSLQSISQQFYGSSKYAAQLASINKMTYRRKSKTFVPLNTSLQIPISDTRLSSRAQNELIDAAIGNSKVEQHPPATNQSDDQSTLTEIAAKMENALNDGEYADLAEQLVEISLLNEHMRSVSPALQGQIYKYLATFLVAYDHVDAAKRLIARARDTDPSFVLTEADSPKIRDLLDDQNPE